ncbi:MAG TPA: M48 family metalloprotease [Syntrophales bacterium]|nr:M48 family metalloprotease [Syntrophales bacterium]
MPDGMTRICRKRGACVRSVCRVLLIVLLCGLAASCATNPVTGKDELMLVSEDEEIKIGKSVYRDALWSAEGGGGEYQDPQLKRYLEGVVMRLHKVSHRPNLPLSFTVQNSSVPNAWAIPGHVVMTRGLLAGLENEGEFAYVMGHEIGHVSARHSARQMSKNMMLSLALGLAAISIGDADTREAVVGLGALGGQLLLLKYSRDDELEADRLGVEYMSRLGYNPNNALGAHRSLEKVYKEYARSVGQEPTERGFFEELLSTHPRTSVRIDEIQQMIESAPRAAPAGDGSNRAAYQSMTANLRRTHRVYTEYYDKAVRAFEKNRLAEANNLVSRAISEERYQPPFYALAGYIYLKQNRGADAERYFRGALSLQANYQPALRGLGMMNYGAKNYAAAIEYMKKAAQIFPGDATAQRLLGMSHYRTSNWRAAIDPLRAAAAANPKNRTIHGILGQCYENVNDRRAAYEQYKLQLQVAPDSDGGRLAASRVQAWKAQFEPETPKKK